MIIFHKARWCNFLSTGATFNEIQLDAHKNTLILGFNGSGKSSLLDVLTFALFGKPYRNINKPNLVNSVNGRDCLVELEFSIGTKKYLLRRGIKPNKFEIYLNGVLMDQDARANDYQEMLEKFIIKMNYKSFVQIVILGMAGFTPFMQLKASDRREVIEDLLDISIFSNMNIVVKERLNKIKSDIAECKIRLDAVKEKIDLHKRHIENLKRNNQEIIDSKNSQITANQHKLVELEKEKDAIQFQINELVTKITEESDLRIKHKKFVALEAKIENNKIKLEKEIEFYKDNDTCPVCKQGIVDKHKKSRIHECTSKVSELDEGLDKLRIEQDEVVKRLATISKISDEIQCLGKNLANVGSAQIHTRTYNEALNKEIEKLTENIINNEDGQDQSKLLFEELSGCIEKRKKASEEKQYLDVAAQLLKDGGIKTRIVKQYLPVINKLVNKYLATMDFFVNFTIDEEFKETIKSRHRDDFSYENFSEGEKTRINLAILFTWRAIARLKNSVNTNLLILDEVFDSSLDTAGIECLMNIIATLENTNLFLISHKGDALQDRIPNTIAFEKNGNFSVIKT